MGHFPKGEITSYKKYSAIATDFYNSISAGQAPHPTAQYETAFRHCFKIGRKKQKLKIKIGRD